MDNSNLLFYDVEVFAHDNLIVLMDYDENIVFKAWNPQGSSDLEDALDGHVLAGFNNYNYDDYVLPAMRNSAMSADGIKRLNDRLISGARGYTDNRCNLKTLDVMQQISVSRPSLKLIEGNMGRSIVETPISFDLDRPLTPEERELVEQYCVYDVLSTIRIYKLREKSYFETKEWLIGQLPDDTGRHRANGRYYTDTEYLRTNGHKWTTGVISSRLLRPDGSQAKGHDSKWAIEQFEKRGLWRTGNIPTEVWDFWEHTLINDDPTVDDCFREEQKKKSFKHNAHGCQYVFAIGGLHGAPTKPGVWHNIKLADVGSMYPSMIVMLEALGDATELYDTMRKDRLKVKHIDKVKADSLKLVLNSCYGNFKNQYSIIYDRVASDVVCIFGQIALFNLCEALHGAGYTIINANTDGVAFVDDPKLEDKYLSIQAEWEKKFQGMVLEIDEFDHWIQKDINNYAAMTGDKVKTKGGEINKYKEDKFFDNNNARIVHIALTEALVARMLDSDSNTRKVIRESVEKHMDDKRLYQYVLRAGSTFLGVQDQNGVRQQNVNRIFATVDGDTKLYKIRKDGVPVNFPDVPEHGTLWNGEVDDFNGVLDLEYYENLAIEKAKGWSIVR